MHNMVNNKVESIIVTKRTYHIFDYLYIISKHPQNTEMKNKTDTLFMP